MVTEGCLVWTRKQLQGKGQRGNRWESDSGLGLCFSVIYFPTFLPMEKIHLLGIFSALALRDFISIAFPGIEAKIKWPNDLIIRDKKAGGILVENSLQGNKIQRTIIGVGLNINQDQFNDDLPEAISLKQITGNTQDLGDLINPDLFQCFDRYYNLLLNGNYGELLANYNDALWGKGIIKTFAGKNGKFSAIPIRVNFDGSLTISEKESSSYPVFWPEVKMLIRS